MHSSLVLTLVITLLHYAISSVQTVIKINPETNQFIDSFGRTRIFHGVNAVYKLPPYVASTDKFDASNSLNIQDAINLKNWGFNIVRLGVMVIFILYYYYAINIHAFSVYVIIIHNY